VENKTNKTRIAEAEAEAERTEERKNTKREEERV